MEDLYPDAAVAVGVLRNSTAIRFFGWLERFLYSRANHVSLISGGFRRNLLAKGVLEFVERVPFSEVMCKLRTSDVGINLVLPIDTAHRLAAPQKLYEYFAANLPVVAADVPTIRRVVKKYKCGLLVDSSSPDEIANALIQLAQDINMREIMGQSARKAAENEYNWEGQVSKLCQLVESLTN